MLFEYGNSHPHLGVNRGSHLDVDRNFAKGGGGAATSGRRASNGSLWPQGGIHGSIEILRLPGCSTSWTVEQMEITARLVQCNRFVRADHFSHERPAKLTGPWQNCDNKKPLVFRVYCAVRNISLFFFSYYCTSLLLQSIIIKFINPLHIYTSHSI